jgi:protein TonB
MRFSALQIGFGVSVLAHGIVFSAASLFQGHYGNAGSDLVAGEAGLEFVLAAEPAESKPSIVAVDPARRDGPTVDKPFQVAAIQEAPLVKPGAPEPETVAPEPTEEAVPTELPAPAEQTVTAVTAPAPEPSSTTASEQATPVSSAEGPAVVDGAATATSRSPGISVSTGSIGAAYLFNPRPPYPAQARARNEEGNVVIAVQVNAEGFPEQVEVSETSGYALLDQAALAAVRTWRFSPARVQDRPIASRVEVPVNFELKH